MKSTAILILLAAVVACGSDSADTDPCPWGARLVTDSDDTGWRYECCELVDGTQHGQCWEGGGCTPYPDCYQDGAYDLGKRCGHWDLVGRDDTRWTEDHDPCSWDEP